MAHNGDRIYVRSGLYHENLQINKSISLEGKDMETTMIDGNWSEGYLRPITVTQDNVSVTGFALSNSWIGISLDKVSGCQISGNKLTNNQYGIMLGGASGNNLTENTITSAKFGAYAIQLNRASYNIIKGNQISCVAEGIDVIDELLSQDEVITSEKILFHRIRLPILVIKPSGSNLPEKTLWSATL